MKKPLKRLKFPMSDDAFKKAIRKMYAYDLVLNYYEMKDEEKHRFLKLIPMDQLVGMFVELPFDLQEEIGNVLDSSNRKELFRRLPTDEIKEFIEALDEDERDRYLALLSKVRAKTIRLLLAYQEDFAASIMTTDFFTVTQDMSVKEITNHVITTSRENDYIDLIYVVTADGRLVGSIELKQLIIARGDAQLARIMEKSEHVLSASDSIECAIKTVQDYDLRAIPVLDDANRILGIITADDVLDEIIDGADEDYQKMALLNEHEDYLSAFSRSKQRLPWLMIAVVMNLVIASILSIFEATLAEVTALVLFQPLILGMAGNIGTQALAATILGLHLESFEKKKIPKRHVGREVAVGAMNSIILAGLSMAVAYLFLSLIPTGSQDPLSFAFVVLIAVFGAMFVSSVMGVLIPLTLDRFAIDPATASGPMMTTMNDLVALVIYFGIATVMFML
jgi:magnesium transporter